MADFKFEIVANEFLTNYSNKASITVKRLGGFKRAYSKEIANISLIEESLNGLNSLILEINQDGIFDHLPEEIFHHYNRKVNKDNLSFAQKHRIKKEEEAHSREFFHPFENEFSNLLILLESYEKNLMDNNNDSEQIYSFFGDISEKSNFEIPTSAKLNFFYPLLPYFRGDLRFLMYVLTSVLIKPITLISTHKKFLANVDLNKRVGEMVLGISSIIGSSSTDTFKEVIINIHELHARDTTNFMNNGISLQIVKLLTQMILPIQTNYSVNLNYSLQEGIMKIATDESASILGYNSYIV